MNGRTPAMKRASSFLMTASLLVTALLMDGAEGLVAQRGGPQQPGGGGRREQVERRIQARFDNLVQEELELTDDQVQQLQDVVEEFRRRRTDFFQRERNARGTIGRLGARGEGAELTDQEASEILAEMLELSGDEATLFGEEQEAFLQILSAPQVVRFIVMRQQFGDRIRALRGGGGAGLGPQGGRRSGPRPLGR
jgi:Spy/CpxP family protein refolding chaperone